MTDSEKRIFEAMGELGAAISQSLPSDDQIIMAHVVRAHALIQQEWDERKRERELVQRVQDSADKLATEIMDPYIDTIRGEWGNTNASVLTHWREETKIALHELGAIC